MIKSHDIKFHDIVTNSEWQKFDPSFAFPEGDENKPRVNVSHSEAMEYAKWLSRTSGKRFRLPTEAEMIEAEKSFKLDTTPYPMTSCPDVGSCGVNEDSCGVNEDGVRDLWGLVFQWTANDADVRLARDQWNRDEMKTPAKEATSTDTGIDKSISAISKAIEERRERLLSDLEKLDKLAAALNEFRDA